jgi:hypothetical protein
MCVDDVAAKRHMDNEHPMIDESDDWEGGIPVYRKR